MRTSLAPIPESLNNILYVAQGEKIRVGVEGTDTYYLLEVDGYYLLHKTDVQAMINELKLAKVQNADNRKLATTPK